MKTAFEIFEVAFNKLMDHEVGSHKNGGYNNHPKDPGGETKWGVSKRAYPKVDIKNLTKEQAKAIYKKDYWDKNRCGDMPNEVAIVAFMGVVNAGNASNKVLQKALGIKADGVVGNQTIAAIISKDPRELAIRYSLLMYKRYTNLKTFNTFGNGWTNRVVDTLNFALLGEPKTKPNKYIDIIIALATALTKKK